LPGEHERAVGSFSPSGSRIRRRLVPATGSMVSVIAPTWCSLRTVRVVIVASDPLMAIAPRTCS